MANLSPSRLFQLPAALRSAAVLHSLAPVFLSSSKPFVLATAKRTYATSTLPPPPSQSSVNEAEVSHFNTLASAWWDPHGSSRLLHLMNPLRHDFIRRCTNQEIHDPNEKLHYLDIGCGGGIFAESAARMRNVRSVTAIDPTPEVIAVARKHQRVDPTLLEPGRLTYLQTSIEELSQQKEVRQQYDIISLFEVIEHIQQPSPFLQSILKHLKPGGWLVGSTIARTPVSWFTTKFMAEEVLGIVPRGTHEWSQYIQPHEMKTWAKQQPELGVSEDVGWQVMGVVYVPGIGWREVRGSETWGNYFFGVKKRDDVD